MELICENGEQLLTAIPIDKIKNELMFEWSINFQNYEVKSSYPNLDTYHIILNFKDNNKLAEVILTVDNNLNVSLLDVCGSLPNLILHTIKETIVKELVEEYKLHAILSVMPMNAELLEDILRDKCTNITRTEILEYLYLHSKANMSKLPKEKQIKFILEAYDKDEDDKEGIMTILKKSLVEVPLN